MGRRKEPKGLRAARRPQWPSQPPWDRAGAWRTSPQGLRGRKQPRKEKRSASAGQTSSAQSGSGRLHISRSRGDPAQAARSRCSSSLALEVKALRSQSFPDPRGTHVGVLQPTNQPANQYRGLDLDKCHLQPVSSSRAKDFFRPQAGGGVERQNGSESSETGARLAKLYDVPQLLLLCHASDLGMVGRAKEEHIDTRSPAVRE